MPATFDSLGIQFLYPDNWTIVQPDEDEDSGGVLMELPNGGFFSIDQERQGILEEELIEEISQAFEEEYEELERETIVLEDAGADELAVDFRFYYLDLLIISRLILISVGHNRLMIQFQAESRDFDKNELVLSAILKQIRK